MNKNKDSLDQVQQITLDKLDNDELSALYLQYDDESAEFAQVKEEMLRRGFIFQSRTPATKDTVGVMSRNVHYPALRLISVSFRVYAWLVLLAGVGVFIVSLNKDDLNVWGIVGLVVGLYNLIICYAIAELLIVFSDISITARKILIRLNKKGT